MKRRLASPPFLFTRMHRFRKKDDLTEKRLQGARSMMDLRSERILMRNFNKTKSIDPSAQLTICPVEGGAPARFLSPICFQQNGGRKGRKGRKYKKSTKKSMIYRGERVERGLTGEGEEEETLSKLLLPRYHLSIYLSLFLSSLPGRAPSRSPSA